MTIADYLIKCLNTGKLRSDRVSYIKGMGEVWKFIPNNKYGPGILVNNLTGSVMSVAEISDRVIDFSYNDWEVVNNPVSS